MKKKRIIRRRKKISAVSRKYLQNLGRRLNFFHLGLTGYAVASDKEIGKELGLQPLNTREVRRTQCFVRNERTFRQDVFREACMAVRGEDPDEWF